MELYYCKSFHSFPKMSRGNASQSCQTLVDLDLYSLVLEIFFVEGRCRLESTSGILGNMKWASRL
jgi:hypothetical protein